MNVSAMVKPGFSPNVKEGPIRCIFFCEFHHTAGPIISCQVQKINYFFNLRAEFF